MFEDSLLESGGRFKKQRNPWAAALSFTIEVVFVALLVLVPMIYTQAVPIKDLGVFIMPTAPTRRADPPRREHTPTRPANPVASNYIDGTLFQPGRIPPRTPTIDDPIDAEVGPVGSSRDSCVGCIPSVGTGANNQAIADVLSRGAKPIMPSIKPPELVRRSEGVMEGLLVRKVTPIYPELAKRARVHGRVMLSATIARDGSIQNLTTISGHPMLVGAAVDAVRQWRYRPYLLNNQPVDVETTVTVTFTLN